VELHPIVSIANEQSGSFPKSFRRELEST